MREYCGDFIARMAVPIKLIENCVENMRRGSPEAEAYFDMIGDALANIHALLDQYALSERASVMRACSPISALRRACERVLETRVTVIGEDALVMMDCDAVSEAALLIFRESIARAHADLLIVNAYIQSGYWSFKTPCLGGWSRNIELASNCAAEHGGRLTLYGGWCEFALPLAQRE